jgi:O-antigen/teichoic acid export membrane protein
MRMPFLEKPTREKGLPRSLLSNRFVADNIVMLLAAGATNLFAYGYQLAMGIMLSPEDYGKIVSLVSLFVIVGILLQTVTTVVTKTTTTLVADSRMDHVGSFYRRSLKFNFLLGIGLFVILIAASAFITRLLNLGNVLYCVILFSSFLFAFPVASNWGILQGLQRFVSLGSNQALFKFLQLLIAVLLVAFGMGVVGGITAIPLSYLLLLVVSLFLLKSLPTSSHQQAPLTGIGRYTLQTLLAFTAITVMTNVDVIIAKHFLTPVEAGNYSAVSVLGRIAFYASAGISAVLFPKAAESSTRGENSKRH